MKLERDRPEEPNDRHEIRQQQEWGIWGLVRERQIFRVDSVAGDGKDAVIHGRIIHTERIIDDGWTIQYDNAYHSDAAVLMDDVSERDRPRVIAGTELELQRGKGPGFSFFRVCIRRNIHDRR